MTPSIPRTMLVAFSAASVLGLAVVGFLYLAGVLA
jgi:hypothetical protein